jgi:hypothetical protein
MTHFFLQVTHQKEDCHTEEVQTSYKYHQVHYCIVVWRLVSPHNNCPICSGASRYVFCLVTSRNDPAPPVLGHFLKLKVVVPPAAVLLVNSQRRK